jgi:primosomal protein N' (replication factor Y)
MPDSAPVESYWKVAVNAPLRGVFTYKADSALELQPGQPVKVPFGPKNREIHGLVIQEEGPVEDSEYEIKFISGFDPERPLLDSRQLNWLQWISDYYIYPLGQTQQLVYPPLKKGTGRKSKKSPIVPEVQSFDPHPLTEEQQQAVQSVQLGQTGTYLLHGVTGSGKTEVYIELIQEVIKQGQSALVLVPEISLTPQLIRRFAERFHSEVAVIHSHLTDREKTDQWWAAVSGEKKLLIGARSALFCPLPDLGLIVIDEEHETSFKQEEKLKYNARDAAIMKGTYFQCPVILGSATPSLESWHNATTGKYTLLTMKNRVQSRPLPEVQIINPRKDQSPEQDLPYWMSQTLFKKLKEHYENGYQSALFLNRRGVAPNVQCYECGFTYECPNCDISLTLHGKHHLVCHYCGYHDRMSEECPNCKEGEPKAYGLGTEAVEMEIKKLFPDAQVLRADRDEITTREALEEMVAKMENHEVHFLIGTQMIAKGLDFKNLSLVGIVHADVAFNIPDFRSNERGFQLCTQVSGRAGRHETPGEVVIQTYKENHPSLLAAQKHDYLEFVEHELKNREMFHYPPFGKITSIRISGMREMDVIEEGQKVTQYLTALVQNFDELKGSQILGPTPAPLSRIKNRYRYHILIKAKDHQVTNFIANKADIFIKESIKKSKCLIDVDPYTLI